MNFTQADINTLLKIMKARRDVRGNHFTSTALKETSINLILQAALTAPSVGYSQPWEFILIDDSKIKNDIFTNFQNENEKAKPLFNDRALYQNLKLEGILEAPVNIAVLYTPTKAPVLGKTSMDKMGEYSVVCAIENMWLMARALGIGMGWVSILDEENVLKTLEVPKEKKLIAYLCLGYVDEFADEPELKSLQWEEEKELKKLLHLNRYQKELSIST